MDKVYEISLLLDFYGQMLTIRQQEILDMHCNNDYSLGEIAQYLKISRQGVFDYVKRGKTALIDFEEKLGLVKKFEDHRERAIVIEALMSKIDRDSLKDQEKSYFDQIRENVKVIISEL